MRYVALLNPAAGDGAATEIWDPIALELMGAGIDVRTVATESREDTIARATEAAAAGARVIAVGGDGMFRDVVAGAAKVAGTVALVPAGRGNDFAAKVGIASDHSRLTTMLATGREVVIDVLDVDGHVVPGNVYTGVDAAAARLINGHRDLPALVLYRGAGLVAVARWKPTRYTLEYPDEQGERMVRVVKAHDVVLANSGRYGHGLNIVPSAEIDDGLIDVLVVKHGPRRRIVNFLLAAQRGTHVERADVEVFRTTSVDISADRDVPFGADGDEVATLPATVKVRPKAVRLVVPVS